MVGVAPGSGGAVGSILGGAPSRAHRPRVPIGREEIARAVGTARPGRRGVGRWTLRTHEDPLRTLALAALLLAPASAGAASGSIVYVKDGDVWLSNPEATQQYRVTYDGGYSAPSQADDGTIVALRDHQVVRRTPSGTPVGAPLDLIGGPLAGGDKFYGPYSARVSPDGTRVAFWFGMYTQYYGTACQCYLWHVQSYAAWSYVDRFTDPTEVGYLKEAQYPYWIDNARVVTSDPDFSPGVSTWLLGGGDDHTQQWFSTGQNPTIETAISRDGQRLATVEGYDTGHGGATVETWTANGPGWTPDGPPWDSWDPSRPKPNEPTQRCAWNASGDNLFQSISFSPEGDALAVAIPEGVMEITLPADPADCAGVKIGLLAKGGTEPMWSAARFDAANAPAAPAGPGTPAAQGSGPGQGPGSGPGAQDADHTAPAVSAVALTRRGVRVRVSEAARLTVRVLRCGRRCSLVRSATVAAQAGTTVVRLKRLPAGRYRIAVAARDAAGNRGARTVAARLR